jgi:hypothetical protein
MRLQAIPLEALDDYLFDVHGLGRCPPGRTAFYLIFRVSICLICETMIQELSPGCE